MREHPMSIVFSNLYGEETWDEDGAPVSDEQVNIAGPIADEFKTNNPGLFKTQVWAHGLRVVGEISVVTDYIYRLREAGLGDYIQLWGSNEWLESYGSNFPDPRIPVVEEITMFAYAYEEGMIDPEWRVFSQIDTVYVYLRQNGWDTSSMSAEDGRRYDDGELGERVMTVRGPKGYADAFRAEYRRRYPDYDTILIQKDYLPERGHPAPEPTNEREYNCYHDPYDWSDMYRTIEQIQMESAQYMADVYVNPSDDWEPISDPDTGEVIGHGRIIIRTTDEYQDIITANGQQWYYPAPIRPAGK